MSIPNRRDPTRTRQAILDAAIVEFSAKGLHGASVNEISARAGANKRMIYHYFGNKDALYLAALEQIYTGIRTAETTLHLGDLAPKEAMRELVLFTWTYFLDHPEFLSLLNTENLHEARYLKLSRKIRDLHSPLIRIITDVLERGAEAGVFRRGVDPVQLYISIAALGFFYLSNRHTLSTIFDRNLKSPTNLADRGEHVVEVILGYLRP